MNKNSRIYIAGHTGLLGTATVKKLLNNGYSNLLLRTHSELDLTRQVEVENFFLKEKPEYVFCMAGKVGGIRANSEKMAEFAMENIQIGINIIEAARKAKVRKLLYLSSSCTYPRESLQPVKEEYLLTGEIEPTNEGYALAKIIGLKLCQYYKRQYGCNFISGIPSNVYGPHDNFDEENNHVIPALLKRMHEAKLNSIGSIDIWGSGRAKREFLYIDDAIDACIHLMDNYDGMGPVNIGVGETTSIKELAEIIAQAVGYRGNLNYDTTKPDGMPERMLDSSKIHLSGWKAMTKLDDGIRKTYNWALENGILRRMI